MSDRELFAQWDADLDAMRERERALLRRCANAMLSNAAPEPVLVATDDAPRLNLGRAVKLARRRPISAKRARHEYAALHAEASGFLRPATYHRIGLERDNVAD